MGDRARKLDKGILITRFELPFNIWWCVILELGVHEDKNDFCLSVSIATTISAWVSVTMLKRERLECTTPHRYSHFGANAICVLAGLRFGQTLRLVCISTLDYLDISAFR